MRPVLKTNQCSAPTLVPSGSTRSNDAATESLSASSFETEQSPKEIEKQPRQKEIRYRYKSSCGWREGLKSISYQPSLRN